MRSWNWLFSGENKHTEQECENLTDAGVSRCSGLWIRALCLLLNIGILDVFKMKPEICHVCQSQVLLPNCQHRMFRRDYNIHWSAKLVQWQIILSFSEEIVLPFLAGAIQATSLKQVLPCDIGFSYITLKPQRDRNMYIIALSKIRRFPSCFLVSMLFQFSVCKYVYMRRRLMYCIM